MDIIEQRTAGQSKFILPDVLKKQAKGRAVMISKRYPFDANGEMIVSSKDAIKMKRILCRYHGCKLVSLDQGDPEEDIMEVVPQAPSKATSQPTAASK